MMTPNSANTITRQNSINRDLLKTLAAPAPVRLIVQTLLEWTWIFMCIAAAVGIDHWAVSLACMVLIATRQHALLILMHEFSHYQFSRKHAGWNDLLGDLFTAFPFFITVHGFRRNHMLHHKHAWTAQDPNYLAAIQKPRYQFPKPYLQVVLEILKHCIGFYTLAELKRYTINAGMAVSLPRRVHIHRLIFVLVLVMAISWFGQWKTVLLYWLIPMATFLMAILYLRDLGEHFGLPKQSFASARTVHAGWFDRLLIAQNGVNFHADHHRYPSVPFFRLHLLHSVLQAAPNHQHDAVMTGGYLTGLLRELAAAPKN